MTDTDTLLKQAEGIAGLRRGLMIVNALSYTRRAFQTGYWTLLLAVTGLYATSFFVPIDIRAAAPFLLALGVAAPSLTYAFLYRS